MGVGLWTPPPPTTTSRSERALSIRSSQNCQETILIIIEIKALSKFKEEKVRFKKNCYVFLCEKEICF